MLNTELIVIELGDEEGNLIFKEIDDITNFLTKMNIQNPNNNDIKSFPNWNFWDRNYTFSEKLYYSAWGMTGYLWQRVWINPVNGYVIAYQDYEGKKFSEHFIEYMENIGPLDTGDLPCNLNNKDFVRNNNNLSLDIILEKIFTGGLESLTMEEVNFLGDISKDL